MDTQPVLGRHIPVTARTSRFGKSLGVRKLIVIAMAGQTADRRVRGSGDDVRLFMALRAIECLCGSHRHEETAAHDPGHERLPAPPFNVRQQAS